MSIVPSLLQAIVHVDGEAMVMHAGDKPYVVSPTGQTDLATRGLTLDAVNGIVNQLLPTEFQNALEEFGAVQYELPAMPEFHGEHFTVVAARGGEDVWVEIRRRRVPDEDRIPDEFFTPQAAAAGYDRAPVAVDDDAVPHELLGSPADLRAASPADYLSLPEVHHLWPDEQAHAPADTRDEFVELEEAVAYEAPTARDEPAAPPAARIEPEPEAPTAILPPTTPPSQPTPTVSVAAPTVILPPPSVAPLPVSVPAATIARPVASPPPVVAQAAPAAVSHTPPVEAPPPAAASAPTLVMPVAAAPPPVAPVAAPPKLVEQRPPPQPAVVLPMSRSPIRSDAPTPAPVEPALSGLEGLLRIAAARGASTLYLSSNAQPSVRVDGELQMVEGESELTARDVESLLLTLMPERNHEALRTGAATEWICDIEDVGRVRCMSFRDHFGPGGVFRLMPTRSVSVEQLGLSRPIQALAIEPEGLVLVAGPRSSGKRTLMAAYVDLINRTRRDHVITIEREINIVHDRGSSFVSQREVRGNDDDLLTAARAALREDPDVLVIEDLRTGGLMNVALEAAASGHLVIGGFSAHTAAAAIDRIIDLYAPEYRRQVQLALADTLRGVIVQVLVRKAGGGRIAAREVLLNTPAVANVLAEGKTSQLPMAIEGGRRHGMVPLNDSLIGFVQSGTVDANEAYRYSPDRAGFLALLKRQGIDTSFAERLA